MKCEIPSYPVVWICLGLLLLPGCVGLRTAGEKRAQQDQQSVERNYRPGGERPALPKLGPDSPLHQFILFAMLNQPQVEAAYFDWVASVRRITTTRSLPDPRMTFQFDMTNIVMSLIPGLMMDFPGPGKLKAAVNIATAESEAKYFAFESSVLRAAFVLKKAFYELQFLDAKVKVNQETLQLIRQIEKIARTKNDVGKATLQDVLRAQIEQDRLTTEIDNLKDSRNPLLAQFKAALGLKPEDLAPPVPKMFESTMVDLTSEQLLAEALERNPRLKMMEAEVRRANASLQLAFKARVPDFNVGIELEPRAGVTLPIWRDKITAQIAEAQASKSAAQARLSAEQIALAIEFAEKSFMFREASRNLELLTERLLPKSRQSLNVAQSGYVFGKVDFLNLLDAQRTLLNFQLSEVGNRIQRELALAELSLIILGTPPPETPLLSKEPKP